MTTYRNIRGLFSVAAALTLSAIASTPALAWDQARVHQPGSFEAIMNAKMPGVFGPKLKVPPETVDRPAPGSFAAFQARRLGIHGYERASESVTSTCSPRYSPGSAEMLMEAKNIRPHQSTCK